MTMSRGMKEWMNMADKITAANASNNTCDTRIVVMPGIR